LEFHITTCCNNINKDGIKIHGYIETAEGGISDLCPPLPAIEHYLSACHAAASP